MLAERCGICSSWRWCGRQCKNAPALEAELADVINVAIAEPAVINANVRRQREWRTRNTDTNRQRAREGMRKRRAAAKEPTS